MKLHLGCGSHYLNGWLNVDGLPGTHADKVIDFFELFEKLEAPEFTHVYWSHGPEHIYPDKLIYLMSLIYTSLVPGGRLTIATIDFEGIYKNRFLEPNNGSAWNSALYGETESHHHPYLSHKQAFTQHTLKDVFRAAGFMMIRPWFLDDYPEIKELNDYARSCELVTCFVEGVR